jgi:hypothetical protein
VTHDPFCYFNRDNGEFDFMADICVRCQLIWKVREDERRQAVERVRARKGKMPSTRLDWGTIADAILDGTKLRLSKEEQAEIYGT